MKKQQQQHTNACARAGDKGSIEGMLFSLLAMKQGSAFLLLPLLSRRKSPHTIGFCFFAGPLPEGAE